MSQRKINVLVIAPYRFLPAVNGGHKAIERLYDYLGRITKVIVVSVKDNDELLAKHVTLLKVFSNSPLHYINPLYFFRLRKIIEREKITHVITEHPYLGWLAFLLKKSLPVSWVVRSHNIEALRFKTLGKWWWKAMWYYEKWVFRKADASFFITKEDKEWAEKHYYLPTEKGAVITYGVNNKTAPSATEKEEAELAVRNEYNIPASHRILLFNGDLSYAPNAEGVQLIIDKIYPLLKQREFAFTILICGRNLHEFLIEKIRNTKGAIIYTGFVNDIKQVFLSADIFLNPVVSGGGIKTKLVEALSYGCNAVSTVSGATGIPLDIIDGKLVTVHDDNWTSFTNAIAEADIKVKTGEPFYEHFYWGNIACKALAALSGEQQRIML